jgi:hypothetical protein
MNTRAKKKAAVGVNVGSLLTPGNTSKRAAESLEKLRQAVSALGSEEVKLSNPIFAPSPNDEAVDDDASDDSELEVETGGSTRFTCESRMGPEIYIRVIDGWGSLQNYVRFNKWNNVRNSHEARRMVQIMDALVKQQGVRATVISEAGEMLMRNIAGLAKSDEWKKPSLMEQFEWKPPKDVIPRDWMRLLVKDAQKTETLLKTKSSNPAPTQKGGAGK